MLVQLPAPLVVEGHALRKGDIVLAPAYVRDCETDTWVPLAAIWPGAPARLLVVVWDWEEGESLLADPEPRPVGTAFTAGPSNCIDNNTLDYPDRWIVVARECPEFGDVEIRGFLTAYGGDMDSADRETFSRALAGDLQARLDACEMMVATQEADKDRE